MLTLQRTTKIDLGSGEVTVGQMMKIAQPKAILTISAYRFCQNLHIQYCLSHADLTVVTCQQFSLTRQLMNG